MAERFEYAVALDGRELRTGDFWGPSAEWVLDRLENGLVHTEEWMDRFQVTIRVEEHKRHLTRHAVPLCADDLCDHHRRWSELFGEAEHVHA